MARADVVNFCMWCDESPCVCKANNKKQTTSKRASKAKSIPETPVQVVRAAPVTRPAIPSGQGIAPAPMEQAPTIAPRYVHSSHAPADLGPSWHGDVPAPTFAQTLEADSDREIQAAKSVLIAAGVIGTNSPARGWRDDRPRTTTRST